MIHDMNAFEVPFILEVYEIYILACTLYFGGA